MTPTWRHQNLHPPPEDMGWHDVPADENFDSSFSTSTDPHDGHSACEAESAFCSFSKRFPHPLQMYSKIGITCTSHLLIRIIE
jgi:hypothetical protein